MCQNNRILGPFFMIFPALLICLSFPSFLENIKKQQFLRFFFDVRSLDCFHCCIVLRLLLASLLVKNIDRKTRKNGAKMRSILEPTSGRLLDPSWTPVGLLLKGSGSVLGRLLASLGASWASFGSLLGTFLVSKSHLKSILPLYCSQKLLKRAPGSLLGSSRDSSWDNFGTLQGPF